ncbi:hypothetical protein [Shrimp glass disease virus]|nr:hypothetical protein [Shrimp glass disease virus]
MLAFIAYLVRLYFYSLRVFLRVHSAILLLDCISICAICIVHCALRNNSAHIYFKGLNFLKFTPFKLYCIDLDTVLH